MAVCCLETEGTVFRAKDRGCTAPGCDVPGYFTEVHHVTPWAKTHTTDINDLALACGAQHKIAEQGWTTRKNQRGDTEWVLTVVERDGLSAYFLAAQGTQ